MSEKLSLSSTSILLEKMSQDFNDLIEAGAEIIPQKRIYKIAYDKDTTAEREARKCVLNSLQGGMVKLAFDTRRIDQEWERNPRTNLQYWNRSEQFINSENQEHIELFAKLMIPLEEIKTSFGNQPEYFESYARQLYDHVERTLRLKVGDQDIHHSQLVYLEQLLFARYRLSMEELKKLSHNDLKKRILDKDELLLKRGAYLAATSLENKKEAQFAFKSGDASATHESIVNAIFGNNALRRDGEKTVERTITITIRDEVID